MERAARPLCTRAIAMAIDDGARPHRMSVGGMGIDERQRQHAGAGANEPGGVVSVDCMDLGEGIVSHRFDVGKKSRFL